MLLELARVGRDGDNLNAIRAQVLANRCVHLLESGQIEALGLKPLVSLTDHDNIEAAATLQALDASRQAPVSIEWTVPVQKTFLHIGVHNLLPLCARSLVESMREFTIKPARAVLREILAALQAMPGVLVLLNHPLWDENGVGADAHRAALLDLLGIGGRYLHAIELNRLRPWMENRQAIQLARAWSKPVVAGGDRHGLEPNVMLNLSRASHFAEFAAKIRGGQSTVMIGNRYGAAHRSRILQNVIDVLGTYEHHGLGRRHWSGRVFYRFDDGEVKSLSQVWGAGLPFPAGLLTRFRGALVWGTEPVVL